MNFAEKIAAANAAENKFAAALNRRWYPLYHPAARGGWVNDPNGFCYALGQYHLFYQHHPFSTQWGPMHWGHVVSDDLVHWHHLPEALAPSDDYDRDGCFSGSAIEHEGRLYLIYTGHVFTEKFGDDNHMHQVQCLACSEDGIHFTKLGVIIEPPEGVQHFRDPKVDRLPDGSFYMVLGARTPDNEGQVWLYHSYDLRHWTGPEVLLRARDHDPHCNMYECPDLFAVGDKYVLAASPMGLQPAGIERNNPSITQWLWGSFDGHTFKPESEFTEVDQGLSFYATQSCAAPDGRRILSAWMNMWHLNFPEENDGWNGAFTLMRELSFKDGRLCQRPVREVQSLETVVEEIPAFELNNAARELCADARAVRLQVKIASNAEQCGIELGRSVVITLDRQHQELSLVRTDRGLYLPRSIKIDTTKALSLDIFIDLSSVEVFVNQGEKVLTTRIFPQDDRSLLAFAGNGSASFSEVRLASLANAVDQQEF